MQLIKESDFSVECELVELLKTHNPAIATYCVQVGVTDKSVDKMSEADNKICSRTGAIRR